MQKERRLLNILSYIYSNSSPKNAKEISNALSIPLSTVYRVLRILNDWGLITNAYESDGFIAGPTSYGATQQFQQYSAIRHMFSPFLEALVKESKETAAIIVPTPHHTLCVALEESPSLLKCSFSLGGKQSLTKGASAKTILAFQEQNITNRVLQQLNIDQQTSLLKELHLITTRGYGLSIGEIDADVWGVSFPIMKKDELLAVLTTMAPYYRAQQYNQQLINLTQKYANQINNFLSHPY